MLDKISKNPTVLIVGLVLAVVATFLFLSRTTNDDGQPYKKELPTIRVGYIPIADCAQLYVAEEKGFFAQEEINVELIKLSGGAKIIEALVGGSVDIAFSNVVSVMLARDAGIPIRPIAAGPKVDADHKETALLVRSDRGVKNLTQLNGKKIAVNTKKNIVELFLKEYLRQGGADYETIEIIEVPFPQMYQFLDSGRVDAVATIEPFVTFSLETGNIHNLGDYITSVHPSVEISTFNTLENLQKESPELMKKFERSIISATEYINTNPDILPEVVAQYTSLHTEQASRVQYPNFGKNIDRTSFQNIMEMVLVEGWIKRPLLLDEILD